MANYKDILAYQERRMAGKNKAYVVFEIDEDDYIPTPIVVFVTTTKAKAEKYIKDHKTVNEGDPRNDPRFV